MEKEKKKGAVMREKMGRREAVEMGVWQLRREEARCVPCQSDFSIAMQLRFIGFSYWFFWVTVFRWDAFVPLHRLWLGYMSELLGLTAADTLGKGQTAHAMKAAMPSAAGMHAKLVKADFHGSIMTSQSLFLPCLNVR